jgi:hypothetical protein
VQVDPTGPEPALVVVAPGTPSPLPPHPATIATSSNVVDHISGLVIFSNLFILLLLNLI